MKIYFKLITFLSFHLGALSFSPFYNSHNIEKLILNKNHEIYKNYDKLGNFKKYFEPNLFSEIDKHHTINLNHLSSEFKQNFGDCMVKQLSASLPHVDSIGHKILHANNLFINDILNNPYLNHDMQKTIILSSIKLAQYGDNMGSSLLELYYNIVDYFL
jgi:hypothetical protein